jgi:hypothetical protein
MENNSGKTTTDYVRIIWGFCEINPIIQVIEHYYKERQKN